MIYRCPRCGYEGYMELFGDTDFDDDGDGELLGRCPRCGEVSDFND